MTQQERERIMALLALISEQSPQPASRARIIFTVDQLSKHPPVKVIAALGKLAVEARRFPTVAEILEMMGIKSASDRDLAVQSAALISGAVRKFGTWGTNDEVKNYVGPLAWKVIQRLGGWQGVCDGVSNHNESFLISQWKEQSESLLRIDTGLSAETKSFLSSETKRNHLRLVASQVEVLSEESSLDI